MARIRKFAAYRRIERPYTRVSKYKKKSFIKAKPRHNIVRFNMGNLKKKFEYNLTLKAKSNLQIRHNAIESARQSSNRLLEKNIGPNDYALKIQVYPHHILRENPVAAGAGADRFSTGMSHSFGKPMSVACQIKKGQTIFNLGVNKSKLELAKTALKRIQHKLPCGCLIEVKQNKLE
jgi:large subunit ribosomal protein L10e